MRYMCLRFSLDPCYASVSYMCFMLAPKHMRQGDFSVAPGKHGMRHTHTHTRGRMVEVRRKRGAKHERNGEEEDGRDNETKEQEAGTASCEVNFRMHRVNKC